MAPATIEIAYPSALNPGMMLFGAPIGIEHFGAPARYYLKNYKF
jgi:hypothetical protein